MACHPIRSLLRNPKKFLFLFFIKLFIVLSVKNGFPVTSWIFSQKFDSDYLKNYSNLLRKNYPRCFSSSITAAENRLIFIYLNEKSNFKISDTVSCSIRSAIKFNPNHEICILSDDQNWLREIDRRKLGKIQLIKILPEALFFDTPLSDWYQYYSQLLGAQKSFSSDKLISIKLAYLWKYGGTVYDTNVISIKSFPTLLKNFLSLQNENEICTNVMKFEPKHRFLERVMDGVVQKYQTKHANFVRDYLAEYAVNDSKLSDDWNLKNSDLFCSFQLTEIKTMMSSADFDSFAERMLDTSIALSFPSEASKKDLSSKKLTFLKTLLTRVCLN